MRNVLVIGGTRNLGPDLVAALVRRGDNVTVLNRGVTPGALPAGVHRLAADRGDPKAFRDALSGTSFDVVVDPTLYNRADAELATAAFKGRIEKYVFWSTGQVYLVRQGPKPPYAEGDYEGPVMAEPAAEREDDHANWVYGVDKRGAEDAFTDFPVVSLRMPMIHSVRDHYQRVPAYVHRMLDGGPILVPGDPDPLPLRHVFGDDVIAATLAALEPGVPARTRVNVSQDRSLTLEECLGLIAGVLGKPLRIKRVARAALEERRLLPACSPFSGRWMSALANDAAKRVLGLAFRDPDDYLPALVESARRTQPGAIGGYARRAEELSLP